MRTKMLYVGRHAQSINHTPPCRPTVCERRALSQKPLVHRTMRYRQEQRSAAGQLGACTQIADFFGNPQRVAKVRLRGDAIRMPSNNLLAPPQLDADFWTEFPYTLCQENCPLSYCVQITGGFGGLSCGQPLAGR